MAAQKGKEVLIKIWDGSDSYDIIGGLRSSSITLNDESVDVTTKDSSGYRTLLAGGGVNSISISGSGVFTDSTTEGLLKDAYLGQLQFQADGTTSNTPAFTDFEFFISTTKDSSGYRTLLAGGGVNSISISGSGVFTDSTTEGLLKDAYLGQLQFQADGTTSNTPAFTDFEFFIPNFFKFTGAFQITSLEYAGEYNGEATYSMSF